MLYGDQLVADISTKPWLGGSFNIKILRSCVHRERERELEPCNVLCARYL